MATSPSLSTGRVIHVCSDSLLRSTRQRVLLLRFVAVSVATAAELELFAGEEMDLVLLCHSLAPSECYAALQIVRRQWPNAQIVLLTRTNTDLGTAPDKLVGTDAGPEFLLHSIEGLLPDRSMKQLSRQSVQGRQAFGTAAETA